MRERRSDLKRLVFLITSDTFEDEFDNIRGELSNRMKKSSESIIFLLGQLQLSL
jgi:hypothetical protein